jgi:hypothetical protein
MTHRLAAVAVALFIAIVLYGLLGALHDGVVSRWH